jgi:putative CocE/NonD family hydrolase
MRRTILVLTLALLGAAAPSARATVTEDGYLTARDGTKLRYQVVRPDGPGPFPTLVNYEGYAAGTNAGDNGVSTFTDRILSRGYALMGLSVRGTGCSEGKFDPFDLTMGTDGYDGIEWAAKQTWSDGRVGMIGVSFGGITQVLTAATNPPHLKAIAASSSLSDLYRDVAYPGGVLEYDFPFAWTAIQKDGGSEYAATSGDQQCLANYLAHEQQNVQRENLIPALILDNPFTDSRGGLWDIRSPLAGFKDIEVPAFLLNAWQDEQLPGRIYENYGAMKHPELTWANITNGNHGRDYDNPGTQAQTLEFLDHFVRDVDNGFETEVPHLNIGMETAIVRDGKANEPSWNIQRDALDPLPEPRAFYLGTGGALKDAAPAGDEAGDAYGYPLPSSDVAEPGPALSGKSTGQFTWKTPVPPGGAAAYTSPALVQDLVVAGPASLDLWLTSTASDVDIQATVTEVRPDGQETYVQRGWLRASHRKLDATKSTALRPFQTHLGTDVQPLTPLEPTAMRLEVFPFAHAFRKGSKLRVWIEAPTGHTGFWAFASTGGPAVNTVLHDAAHPSRLVLGALPGEVARAPLPACDTLRNQPCRTDPLAAGVPAPAKTTRSRCAGGRLSISLRPGMRRGVVRLNGRRVATLTRSHSARVRGSGVLTVDAVSRSGRRVQEVRRVTAC